MKRLINIGSITTLSAFLVVSIPSIKLLFSNPIINFMPLFLLFGCFLVKIGHPRVVQGYNLGNFRILSVLLLFIACVIVFYVIGEYSVIDAKGVVEYIYFIAILALITLQHQDINEKVLFGLILGWAVFLSCYHILIGFSFDRSKGQHYLTYGLPVGAGLTAALIGLFTATVKRVKIRYIVLILIILVGLLISRGRSSLIFPCIISILYFMSGVLFAKKNKARNLTVLTLFIGFLAAIAALLSQLMADVALIRRLSASASGEREEPRLEVWTKTVELIFKNPLGYGVNSYEEVLGGSYPHNMLLEGFLSFGFVGGGLLLVLVVLFFIALIRAIRRRTIDNIKIGFVALYFFLCWNTSYDLTTSYIPLSLMLLIITKQYKAKKVIKLP